MKKLFHKISQKTLSLILALCLILTSMAATFAVFAEAASYEVGYNAPAIPMVKGTKLSLNDVSIQLTQAGEYVPGSLISWSNVDAGLRYDATTNEVSVYATGVYGITASYAGVTKRVYVVAAETADGPFNIFEYDFANFTSDLSAGKNIWKFAGYKKASNNDYTSSMADKLTWNTTVNGLKFGSTDRILWTTNDVLKEFTDYTIKTTAGSSSSYGGYRNYGVVARIVPGANEASPFADDSKLIMAGLTPGDAANSPRKVFIARPVYYTSGLGNWETADKSVYWTANTSYDYAYKFEGKTVTISVGPEGGALTEVYSFTDTKNLLATTGGGIGVYSDDTACYFKHVAVELDIDEIPAASPVDEIFTVDANNPIIAMGELTKANLNNVLLGIGDTYAVAGAKNVTWNTSKAGQAIMVKDGYLYAYAKGMYQVDVTYQGVTAQFYVIVSAEGENEYVIYEQEFGDYSNGGNVPDGWKVQYHSNKKASGTWTEATTLSPYISRQGTNYNGTTGAAPFTNQTASHWSGEGYFVLDNEIVSNFADYRITAEIVGYSHYNHGAESGFGIFGRANTTNGALSATSSWTQVYMNTKDSSAYGYNYANATGTAFKPLNTSSVNTGFNTTYKDDNDKPKNASTTLVADFKGNTVSFWAKGEESNVYSATVSNTQAGAVGIVLVRAGDGNVTNWAVLKNIKVALNNVKVVPTEAIDIYKVECDVSPAIPMDAMTYVDTAEIMIKVDGTYILGSSLDLKVEDGVTGIEISNGTIRAYDKGSYKLTATDVDGNKQVVYVVVKNPTDTSYEIYSETFGDYTGITTFPSNWKSQWRQDGNSGAFTRYTWGDFESPRVYETVSGLHQSTTAPGIVPFSNTRSWSTAGYFTLSDETVSAFSDYTVIATMAAYAHHNGATCGVGIFGRANTTTDGKLNNNSTLTGVYSASHNSKKLAQKIESAPGADAATAAITYTTLGENWDYTNRNSRTANVTMVAKFAGENILTYMDGDDQSFTATTTNTKNGTVGIYAGMIGDNNVSSQVNLREFKVVLNNAADDKPAAKEIKFYTVSDASPAIPMNAMTQVKVSDLIVNVNGKNYLGQQLTFTEIENYRGISISDGIITAYEKGIFPVRVTNEANGDTDTVYVVVKNRTDANWVIYSEKFGDEYAEPTAFPDNWKSQYYLNQYAQHYDFSSGKQGSALGLPAGDKFTFKDYTTTASYTNSTVKNNFVTIAEGIIPFTNFFSVAPIDNKKLSLWDSPGFFTLNDEIVNDFSDYTLSTTATIYSNFKGVSGTGLFGRVPVDENGRLDSTSTGFTLFVANSSDATAYSQKFSYGVNNSGSSKSSEGWNIANYATYTFTARYEGTVATFSDGVSTIIDTAAVKKGAVGVVTHDIGDQGPNSSWSCIKNFEVYLNDTDDTAPTSNDLAYDMNNLKVPVNNVFDLSNVGLKFGSKTILGFNANINNVRTTAGEVSNGMFVAFAEGEVEVTANYDGVETTFTVKVVNDGTDNVYAVPFADETVAVEPIISDATDSAYYVTATAEIGKELAALGIIINENGKELKVYHSVDNTGNKFRFETLAIEKVTISANYVEKDVVSVAPLGATIRLPDAAKGVKTGIKFGNRINIVKNDGTAVKLKDTANIKIGDTLIENVTIKEIGTLVIPTALVGDELLYTTPNAIKKKATSVSAATAAHSDITAVLVDIPEDQYNLSISARAYVAYTLEGDDDVYYYYGDVIERTYNDVYTAAQPARHYYNEETGKYGDLVVDDGTIQDNSATTIQVERVLEGGTDHYLDSIAQTDDISYRVGETITYAFRIKGNYKLRYTVYKDNAAQNLYGKEAVKLDSANFPHTNEYVKSGTYAGDVLKFSTQMNQPGAIWVKLEVLDQNNIMVASFNHTVIVDFDNVKPAVAAPTYYYDENGNKVNSTVAEFYQASKNEWAPLLEKIQEEVNSAAFQTYWSDKKAGAVYNGTYIYAERKADKNGYLLYDIQIATEEPSKVLSGATKVRDIIANTTNNKFLYNDFTVRPATFNLTLKPGAAEGSLGVSGAFQGYGNANTAGTAGSNSVLYVNMNSHGILNNQSSAYYTAIHKVSSKNGGTSGFCMEYNPNAGTGVEKSPTELYFYGMIKRDYFGLQFAKMLPEYNADSKNAVSGGSMGGFRSVLAAAFDSSIKRVDASYTWMGSLGGLETDKIAGHFMPANTIGIQYFSTVHAAATLGSDVTLNLKACGLGDYTSPPLGLVAAYNMATCNKSIELRQYREHGTTRTANHYDMFRQKFAWRTESVSMPTGLDGQTLTEEEVLKAYRGYTDYRIGEIHTTEDTIKPASGGTAYYVSNKGSSSNDGKSPSKPLKTINDVNNLSLKSGDVVYFERGGVFRGQVLAKVGGVTYAAYGTGDKPQIYASPNNAAQVGSWTRTNENRNVYKYNQKITDDVGNIIFNGGAKHGIKCIIRVGEDGKYNRTTGKKFDTYADLDEDLHFYYDPDTDYLYLYCRSGNPSYVFDSIELAVRKNIIQVSAKNVRVDNLCLKYGGAHGVSSSTQIGLTVTNSEFYWIGGSIQIPYTSSVNANDVRYGNAIEIYGGCDGFTIKNCYFNQIYDAAVTFQYNGNTTTGLIMKNIDFSDNVIENCNYSFEYFLNAADAGTGSYIQDVMYSNNLSWYAGYGFCEQRPDKGRSAHVKSWNHPNSLVGEFVITNNLFAMSKTDLVQSNAKVADHSPTYIGNTYIQFTDLYLGTSRDVKERVVFDKSVVSHIKDMLLDSKATVVYVKK